jgi:hypothetical protein
VWLGTVTFTTSSRVRGWSLTEVSLVEALRAATVGTATIFDDGVDCTEVHTFTTVGVDLRCVTRG